VSITRWLAAQHAGVLVDQAGNLALVGERGAKSM
jgi:hypothetical protein